MCIARYFPFNEFRNTNFSITDKQPHKYYTNLIKGKFWTRDRLQVNAPQFNNEKIGQGENEYYHRLATELDDFYIHELRHRPPTRKFCVKT